MYLDQLWFNIALEPVITVLISSKLLLTCLTSFIMNFFTELEVQTFLKITKMEIVLSNYVSALVFNLRHISSALRRLLLIFRLGLNKYH